MRNIPRVMSVHMSMAANYWRDGFAAGDMGAHAIEGDMQEMMRGIQAYMQHPYKRSMGGLDVALEIGSSVLLRVAAHNYTNDAPSILLVPSLINKSYILDLTEERSLLRYLCAQGVNAYLLDWGELLQDEDTFSLDDAVGVITRAAEFLHERHGEKIHMLGYCMGGTLASAAAYLRGDLYASLICMAAPWDFHGGTQALTNRVKFWAPTLLPVMKDKGHMTVDWLQMLFASLDPALAAQKFARFAELADEDSALFVAVEDWLNDGVCLPEVLAGECIKDWFFENAPMEGAWNVCGKNVKADEIEIPIFVLASSKDRLVEFETAKGLADQAPNAKLYNPECGHIGMIAGKTAQQKVWEPIVDWIKTYK